MKPTGDKASTYFDYDVKNNDKDPKFKAGNHVRILKYQNIFANFSTLNWSEDIFTIKRVQNTIPWTYIIEDFNRREIVKTF